MQFDDAVLDDIYGDGWINNSSVFEWRDGGVFVRKVPEHVSALLCDEERAALRAHPTGTRSIEPVLSIPFSHGQFQRFLEAYPLQRAWIETDYAFEMASVRRAGDPKILIFNEDAIEELAAINPAAEQLVRLVVAGAPEDVDPPADVESVTAAMSVVSVGEDKARAGESSTVRHRIASRRDVLDPSIDAAIERAGTADDVAAVWNAFYAMASEPAPKEPLIGAAEGDVKYWGGNGDVNTINRKVLGQRLTRRTDKSRQGPPAPETIGES